MKRQKLFKIAKFINKNNIIMTKNYKKYIYIIQCSKRVISQILCKINSFMF